MRFPEKYLQEPGFFQLPEAEQIKRVSGDVPEFGSLAPERQRKVLSNAQRMAKPAPPPGPPESNVGQEGIVGRVGRNLKTGFQSGAADLAKSISGVAETVGAKDLAKRTADFAASAAPPPGPPGTVVDQVVQGVGAAPAAILKYAPAAMAGKYAPVAAGVIGAASHIKDGWKVAVKEGVKDAAMFYAGGKASKLPTRAARVAGNAAVMGGVTAVSGGDAKEITSAAILGAGAGAVAKEHPKAVTPEQAKALLEGGTAGLVAFRDNVRKLVAPQNRGPEARKTALSIRAHNAEIGRQSDIADHALKEASKSFRMMPDEQRLEIIHGIETGKKHADPKMQGFVDTMRDIHNGVRDELMAEASIIDPNTGLKKPTALKTVADALNGPDEALRAYYENYFPHLFTDPEKASQVMQSHYTGKKPLEGPATFLKQRKHPTIEDALWTTDESGAKVPTGLKLIATDPVESYMLKWREMKRFTAAQRIMKDMGENSLIEWVPPGKRGPHGWVQIQDRSFQRSKKGGEVVAHAWAPEGAARVLNNYLSPGLRKYAAFRGLMTANNVLNQSQLGFSAFHLGFTSVDAVTSKFALGIEEVIEGVRRHEPKLAAKGGKDLVLGTVGMPIAWTQNIKLGNRLMKEWKKPGSTNPETAQLVAMMQEAGGGIGLDPVYKTDMTKKVFETFRNHEGYLKLAYRMPLALNEQFSKLIMEKFVPRQKLGVFADMARFEMERMPEGATREQVREVMAKAWDSVDNRMGMLRYDNLFWDKAVKDMAMATTRSVGWNLGTVREIGGGGLDFRKSLASKFAGRHAEVTHRMAYVMALPAVTSFMGSLVHWMYNGKPPETFMDSFFPRTGRKDEFGRDERLSIPSYIKDLYHAYIGAKDFAKGAGSGKALALATSKVHSSWGVMADMLNNRDFYNTEIANADDPLMKRVLDYTTFLGKQYTPFSWANIARQRKEGAPVRDQILAFGGLIAAPSDVKKTTAERLASDIMAENLPKRSNTREERERQDKRRELERRVRTKDKWEDFARGQMNEGQLSEDDVLHSIDRAAGLPLDRSFTRMRLQDSLRVWDAATDEEKVRLRPLLEAKVENSAESIGSMPAKQREKLAKKILAILNEGAPPAPPPGR